MLERLSGLKSKLISPFVFKINPNLVSTLALVCALIAGYLFWQSYFIFGAVFVFLNGFFDVLDGAIAKKFEMQSKFGDFIDHTFDRLADVAILLGLTLSPQIPDLLGFATLVAVLLVSYLGTQAQALTGKRLYSAFAGRSDRLVILTIAGFLTFMDFRVLIISLWLILVLSAITFLHRFYLITKKLKA